MKKMQNQNQNQINLQEKTVTELKALAYDFLSILNNAQNNLKIVNTELEERAKKEESNQLKAVDVEAITD